MEYAPGMNFSEKELCKTFTFKVCRTPLCEAIRRLEDLTKLNDKIEFMYYKIMKEKNNDRKECKR